MKKTATFILLVMFHLAGLEASHVYAQTSPIGLYVVSVNPSRTHLVPAGEVTTFVIMAVNWSDAPDSAWLAIGADDPAWSAQFAETDSLYQPVAEPSQLVNFTLEGYGTKTFLVSVRSPADAPQGGSATATAARLVRRCGSGQEQLRRIG